MSRISRQHRGIGRAVTFGLAVGLAASPVQAQTDDSALASPTTDLTESDNEGMGVPDRLPPGHPHVDSTQAAPGTGDARMPGVRLARDTVSFSNSVPVGALEIHVLDADSRPISGTTVVVQLHRESVAEGNTESKKEAVSDVNGIARVDRLLTDSAVSYRVKVVDGGVTYGMQPFQLNEHAGAVVTLHRYPIARDLTQSMVAMQSLVFVEPKDDVFQFEIVYDIYNIGKTTWVPDKLTLRLPSHWKAFNAQASGEDVRIEATEDGVRMTGAVSPGQHQITYMFQVPRHNTPTASFELDMPPNTMLAKVGLASSRNSELSVEGFSDPEPMASQSGQRMLVATKTFDRSTQTPSEIRFDVRGLPTVGMGRIVAAIVAIVLASIGLLFALFGNKSAAANRLPQSLVERGRERLLEELTELEAAKANGKIGPKTYQETRNALVEALVRLEPLNT